MNLLRTLATVSGMTFLSRILGFVRDFVIARTFGAGIATDAFFVAFRLPNLLRRLFAEGAFSQAFVPIMGEYKNKRGLEATKHLIDHVFSLLFIILLIVTVLGILGSPILVAITAPGFANDAEKVALTITLTRITFPYILFMSLVALAAGILNTWNRFTVPAITPILLNITFIVMAFVGVKYFDQPVMALGWAVFIGGILQLGLQLPELRKIGMLPRFSLSWADPGVRRVLKLMAPAVIGVSVSQISLIINTIFASFLDTGSVSWLYYADRLMEFPSGMLGAALGTILLPSLSKHNANGNRDAYSNLLDWGLKLTFLLATPAAVALALISYPLVTTLFLHGAFSAFDAQQTTYALTAYSVGLTPLILVKVMAPGFYARQNIRTPVKIAITTLISTQLLNLLLIGWLKHAGLALSISCASWLNAALLFRGLRQQRIYTPIGGWRKFITKLAIALVGLAFTLYLLNPPQSDWVSHSVTTRIMWLARMIVGASAVYFFVLWCLGFRLRDFQHKGAD